jgi:gamma-glutamyl hydrolase
MFIPTSISYDKDGKPFVASMESEKYPFYGVQFHPEKAQFFFYPPSNVDHTEDSIYFNRYFADFFICKAKGNINRYINYETETSHIIENYDLIVTSTSDGSVYAF